MVSDIVRKRIELARKVQKTINVRSSPSSAIKKATGGGRTDRPASWKPDEQTSEEQPILSKIDKSAAKEYVEKKEPETVELVGIKKTEPLTGISKKEKMTKQEYVQETYQTMKNIEREKNKIQEKQYIEPYKKYIVKSDSGKDKIISGSRLMVQQEIMRRRAIKEYEKAEIESQKIYQQSLYLPEETIITKKKSGYEFSMPETSSLKWTKDEFKKIDRAYNINPALGFTSELGFGITSSFAAFGKPLADIALDRLGIEKKPVHYVSPFDVAFEPIGWSPKGSTDILRKRPVFAVGGIVGEIAQSYAMAEVFKPVGTVVKIGAKAIVRKTPVIYSKLGRPLPNIIGKISEKPIVQNISKWSKGYVPASSLFEKKLSTKVKDIFTIQKSVYKTKGFGKRVWISPEDVIKIQSKLRGDKEFSFFVRGESGIGKATSLYETTMYKTKGLFSKKVFRTYKFASYERSIGGKLIKNVSDEPVKPLLGSYYRGADEGLISVMNVGKAKEDLWFKSVREMYEHGYPQVGSLESGAIRVKSWTPGFGTGISQPLPKKWITKAKTGLIRSKEAMQSVIPISINRGVLKYPSRKILTGGFINLPVRSGFILAPGLSVMGLRFGLGYISKVDEIYKLKRTQPSVSLSGFKTDKTVEYKNKTVPVQINDVVNISDTVYDTGFKYDKIMRLDLPLVNKNIRSIPPVSPVIKPFEFKVKKPGIAMMLPDEYIMRRKKIKEKKSYGDLIKLRGIDVYDPFKINMRLI